MDQALDYYNELVGLVRGQLSQARGAADLNRTLKRVLAGIWVELDGARLQAEFQLRVTDEPDTDSNGLRQVLMRSLGERRFTPWRDPANDAVAREAQMLVSSKLGLSRSCTTTR